MVGAFRLGEALLLGLASGPACIASCGPVIVPSLLAEKTGFRISTRYLGVFLSTRLTGYLLFALIAWQLGTMASLPETPRSIVFGAVHLSLAVVLLWYAHAVGRQCSHGCAGSELVTIGLPGKRGVPGAGMLGFLTGISLCPPFVAAGVRAAELSSAAAAVLFFAAFFLGTSIWFVPFIGFSCIRRNEAVITVARMAMVLIALYYGYLGLSMLAGRKLYG